jgi:hypothetical protein
MISDSRSCFIKALKEMSELSEKIKVYRQALPQLKRQEFDGVTYFIALSRLFHYNTFF